jgi:hypothetical protein
MWLRRPEVVAALNEGHNVPVAFYGQVVDSDGNGLANAAIHLHVKEEHIEPFPEPPTGTNTHLQRQTGADGRFEVNGLIGHSVMIEGYMKEGYEPDVTLQHYGDYPAQSGSFTEPIIFRMWNTNIPHEQLITGDKWFPLIPDGRRYGVDLTNNSISEGVAGDLVVWIKRPASPAPGERFAWSCELLVNGGGLQEEMRPWAMYLAPADGYTNVFACHQGAAKNPFAYPQEAGSEGWSGQIYGKRFYIKLRNGQMYGQITLNLLAGPGREGPSLIGLKYAVNPSGSRLLR